MENDYEPTRKFDIYYTIAKVTFFWVTNPETRTLTFPAVPASSSLPSAKPYCIHLKLIVYRACLAAMFLVPLVRSNFQALAFPTRGSSVPNPQSLHP